MTPDDRVHALAFNALGKALGEADEFIRLSDREAITAAVVTAVRAEIEQTVRAKVAEELIHSYPRLVTTERDDARQRAWRAETILRDLVDPDPCRFDHHGGCQAHGYLSLKPGEQCPHAEAKELLAALDQEGTR